VRGADAAAAAIVATMAFVVFAQTLLPGIDLGDTGSFQAAVTAQTTSARQAYPLYFGLATPFVTLTGAASAARALNLFSALCGAAAVGLLAWIVGTVTASRAGGAFAGLLLAFSYTFWTQSVIAEVYTLHLALIGLLLIALRAWQQHQTLTRLAIVCAAYALMFGNHLSAILLLPPQVLFIASAHPRPLELLRPRVIAGGALIALIGALQYLPIMLATWSDGGAPPTWTARLARFWFDVTKADWRVTMVLGFPGAEAESRLAMWMWDARQQFGAAGLLLALLGVVHLWRRHRPWAWLVSTAYIVNTAFALTYNVGDTHVFLLPGHFFTAFAAGAGVAFLLREIGGLAPSAQGEGAAGGRRRAWAAATAIAMTVVALSFVYVAWRGWTTWPAADRHLDRRGDQFVQRTFFGLSERDALLVSHMQWDQENALYAAHQTPIAIPWVRLNEVMLHFPYLVRDNLSIGRDVVLTADAAPQVVAAYGSHFPIVRDEVPVAPSLAETVARIPRGAPYVITILTPLPGYDFDENAVTAALDELAGRPPREGDAAPATRQRARYEVTAGVAGESPAVHVAAGRPFVRDLVIAGDTMQVRFDSWLPFDTFRRGGFGHVLLDDRRILFVERGVSLVWLDRNGAPQVAYAAGVYAPRPRYRIPVPTSRLASR
jgi:hypothetical protein